MLLTVLSRPQEGFTWFAFATNSQTRLAVVAAELIFQNFAEQNKSNTAKHPFGEEIGRDSTGHDVADDDRFVFVLLHRRKRAENKNEESN